MACLVQARSEEEAESELEVAHTLLGLSEWKVSNAISPVLTGTSCGVRGPRRVVAVLHCLFSTNLSIKDPMWSKGPIASYTLFR